MKRRRLPIFVALFVGSLLVPLAVSEGQVSRSGQADAVPAEDYRIGLEDTLTIVVWKNETLSRPMTVRPDQKISLPLVNDIQAAGLTPAQPRTEITRRLTEFMPTPEVSVM